MKSKCLVSGCDGKGNNLHTYEDGGTYCFACGTSTQGDGTIFKSEVLDSQELQTGLVSSTIHGLPRRGISERTCRFIGYGIGPNGEHVANYFRDKTVIGQKIRGADKKFYVTGDMVDPPLYGQWLYTPNNNIFVTVCEGEIDELSILEVNGTQWPVVSLPLGANRAEGLTKDGKFANTAKRALINNLSWLAGFKHVVLAFDSDDVGVAAMKECQDILEPGKVKIVHWPLKDANEMLLAGRGGEIKNLLFGAKDSYEEHLVTISDLIEDIVVPPKIGIDFPWESLTTMTYGFRLHELYIFVGPNGCGKTEMMKEIMFNFLEKDIKIGLFSFEQRADSTAQRLVGAILNKKLHIPGVSVDPALVRKHAMSLDNKIFLCKNAGSRNIKQICNDIRYWVKAKGIKLIIIDNLKGLSRNVSDENKAIKQAMLDFQALVQELDCSIFLISHVAKDKFNLSTYVTTSPKNAKQYFGTSAEMMEAYTNKPGLSWESGRMPMKENVEGSSTICDLADYVFALARDSVNRDPVISSLLRVKCLKARLDGGFAGHTIKLMYTDEGRLMEDTSSLKEASDDPAELFYEQ